ncbi:MAG: tRNA uridine-5-carboxymethylaminomethyl(34) synthesis GTPase MnmE [Alphaproteobacteria bacterium]|nr:tRNA uridine-5-carboxymethylaminomethyl(34) synthesis GTPase MnmE [Alphaproteobacteria bacterium]
MPGHDTVAALSSAPGRAGVAVLRVSGPEAGRALQALAGMVPRPREAVLATLRSSAGEMLDRALVLWFPAPASFTGEDVAEFHVHGGRAVVEAVLAALVALGLRPAEPGEFTRRAVENGKFDLTGAEALIDLIDAETDAQRRQALSQHGGALAALYDSWRARLIHALAWAEATIDFSDEELPEHTVDTVRNEAIDILDEIKAHLDDAHRGELVREGLYLIVIGQPNSGKSTLVNALARRDVAIVSETAGTTRDVIEVRLDLGGYAVTLADTAGLRAASEAVGAVEAEGVRRALARAEAADLVVLVLDGTAADPFAGIPDAARAKAGLTVWNKADLGFLVAREGLAISARTGQGLPELIAALAALVKERLSGASEAPLLTRARHREALEDAAAALARALAGAPGPAAPELFAEDLRLALRALGRITGRVDVEELLDVVFRDFCIGK